VDPLTGPFARAIDGADAVINLAGESIAGRRWTPAQKRRILDSRVLATRSLVAAVRAAKRPPEVLISGSAVGYYRPLDDVIVTEERQSGADFLSQVCVAWETEAQRASGQARMVCVRTGIVLERDGGALPKMLPPFWFGAGGPVGSGRQYWPWIHRRDWVDLIRFAMRTATRYEAAVRTPVQKNSVPAAASDRANVWYSHSASIDCTTNPPPNASRLNSAASVYTVFRDLLSGALCRPGSVTSVRGSPR
jgi:uncharacterized protein (TIGR01777 family)